MKHTHCELIKQWAEDTSLVRFYKDSDCWHESRNSILNWVHDLEYHLVCKKHAEVCLHWLNGGEVEVYSGEAWFPVTPTYFTPALEYRIKPKWKPEVGELCHFYDNPNHSGKINEGNVRGYKQSDCGTFPFADGRGIPWRYCEPLSAVGLKVI